MGDMFMVLELSSDLEQRLKNIAQQNECSVEELLAKYADEIEQSSTPPNTAEQLAQALKYNERILEAMFNGYIRGDLNGNIIEANKSYCDMMGYTREEILHLNIYDLDAKFDTVEIGDFVELILEDQLVTVETRHRRKDGKILDVEINGILYDEQSIACFVRNITEEKQLEKQLRRNAQLYHGLVERQIDFVCRYTPDTILTYVNEAYCEFFGYTSDELIGKSFLTLTPIDEETAIYNRLEVLNYDITPDVRIFHADDSSGRGRWIQWVDYAITDDDDNLIEIQAVGRDVTSLIETQQQLAERENMLSIIFQNVPIMLSQLDESDTFIYVNQHWVDVFGWTLEEIQAHDDILGEIFPDDDYRLQVNEYIQSDDRKWRDLKIKTRAGNTIETSWTKVILPTGSTLYIGQDITQRIELENERALAERLEIELENELVLRLVKERFVSLVSHEFRTPLAVMLTSLELVLVYYDRLPVETITQKLNGIRNQILRMVDLMEDALRFSKVKSGQMEIVAENVDVIEICENVIDALKATDTAGHDIVLIGDSGVIRTDPSLFNLILSNLVSNAIKYSPAGQITILITQNFDNWEFSVVDQGIGIPKEEISNLFDPFYRATNALKLPGTGLGLSIVKDYVEIQGGNITVESTPNVGTTMTFSLPAINTVGV